MDDLRNKDGCTRQSSILNKWLSGAALAVVVGLGSTAAYAQAIAPNADFNAGANGTQTYSPVGGALYQATTITSFGSGFTVNSLDTLVGGLTNDFVANNDPVAGSVGSIYQGVLNLAPGTGVFQTTNIANFLTFGSSGQFHFRLTGYEVAGRTGPSGPTSSTNFLDISMIGVFTDTSGFYSTQNASIAWSGQSSTLSGGDYSSSFSFTTPPTFTPPPLPDPASLLLIGLGAVVMVGMRHRARN